MIMTPKQINPSPSRAGLSQDFGPYGTTLNTNGALSYRNIACQSHGWEIAQNKRYKTGSFGNILDFDKG